MCINSMINKSVCKIVSIDVDCRFIKLGPETPSASISNLGQNSQVLSTSAKSTMEIPLRKENWITTAHNTSRTIVPNGPSFRRESQ